MQYSILGNTGLIVSRLSLGAMTFTKADGSAHPIFRTPEELSAKLVGQALDAGVNFFDTADAYADGESEIILGNALKGERENVIIATKVGFRSEAPLLSGGLSRRHILKSVENSLKRLGTDYIDIYIAHREDRYTPLDETLEALDICVKHGKVRYLGFSNWMPWKVAAALERQRALNLAKFSHGQMYYSLVGRDVEHDTIPMMRHYGLGMTVWSPLAMGFLTGRYTRENWQKEGGRLDTADYIPIDHEAGFKLIERMGEMAREKQTSVAQLAIAWLLSKDIVSSIILGASKPEQLADTLKAADITLSSDEIATIEALTKLTANYPAWFHPRMLDQVTFDTLGPPKNP